MNVVARKPEKSTPDTNPYLKKFLSNIKWAPKKLGVLQAKLNIQNINLLINMQLNLLCG